MDQDGMKHAAAEAALDYLEYEDVIGVGSGSTVNLFIDLLPGVRGKLDGAVATSAETEKRLRQAGIPILDLNRTGTLRLCVDGADEANRHRHLIKGGGGALTREKIVAEASEKFVCMVDQTKMVEVLGSFPLPVEVIPMAQSLVGRAMVKLGGQPRLREGFTTDNGNLIIDVLNFDMVNPAELESAINQIPGVVSNGIFARRGADVVLVGTGSGVERIQ